MYYLFSAIMGFLIAVMLVFNGGLTAVTGAYSAAVIIHIVGLICISLICIIKKDKLFARYHLPAWMYLGGAIGFGTTLFTNLAFGGISVSAILALGLLGQSLTAIAVDQFGILGMEKRPFQPAKLLGLILILAGILCMLFPLSQVSLMPMIVSLLSGFTIVMNRTFNARLAEARGVNVSSFYNFVTGLIVAFIALLILGRGEAFLATHVLPKNPLLFCGGLLGLATVMLSNVVVVRISAFYMTLFMFVGQVGTGLVLDTLLEGAFSPQTAVGGLLVTLGLCLNLYLDAKTTKGEKK